MREITVPIYEFSELSEEAKARAINDHINYWMEIYSDLDDDAPENLVKAVHKAEAMRTPWFTSSYIYVYCQDELLEELNMAEFYFDGAFFKWIE
jgi:hypothetical protein